MHKPPFPVTDPVPSFWTSDAHPLDEYQSTPELPQSCDVLIIGSGYAGTAVAYHLLKDRPGKSSVILLEARQICSGATARNGGHVKPDTYFGVTRYSRLYGVKAAAEIVKFESSQVLAVKDLVEKEQLDCDFHLTRGIDVYLNADFAERTADAFRKIARDGSVDVRDVQYTGPEHAERVSALEL
jgi:glycine/D-amino acid oxidase-like deaminating enzyme